MLTNAKKMRENYIERVKKVADDIINVIADIEDEDIWADAMNDEGEVDVLYCIGGGTYEPGVYITEVYDYLTTIVDERISETKTVIEALEEVFDIDYDPWTFELILKGYDKNEKIAE